MATLFILLGHLCFVATYAAASQAISQQCLDCICFASTGCDVNKRCHNAGGDAYFCGPYQASWAYWSDGGKPGYSGGPHDFERCLNNKNCAEQTVIGYMAKYKQDCNGDGEVSCDDYALIHKVGGNGCSAEWIYNTDYWKQYKQTQCYSGHKSFIQPNPLQPGHRPAARPQTQPSYPVNSPHHPSESGDGRPRPEYPQRRPALQPVYPQRQPADSGARRPVPPHRPDQGQHQPYPPNNGRAPVKPVSWTVYDKPQDATSDGSRHPSSATDRQPASSDGHQNGGYPAPSNEEYPPAANDGYPPNGGYPSPSNDDGYPSTDNDGYPSSDDGYPAPANDRYPAPSNDGYPSHGYPPNEEGPSSSDSDTPLKPVPSLRPQQGHTVPHRPPGNDRYPSSPEVGHRPPSNDRHPAPSNDGYPSHGYPPAGEGPSSSDGDTVLKPVPSLRPQHGLGVPHRPPGNDRYPSSPNAGYPAPSDDGYPSNGYPPNGEGASSSEVGPSGAGQGHTGSRRPVGNPGGDTSVSVSSSVAQECLDCMCQANTGCDLTKQCESGVCGPYLISWVYWADAGKLWGDYALCANDKRCAEATIDNYMTKWKTDCNGDGIIDCDDYVVMHKLGPNACNYTDYSHKIYESKYWQRYDVCARPSADVDARIKPEAQPSRLPTRPTDETRTGHLEDQPQDESQPRRPFDDPLDLTRSPSVQPNPSPSRPTNQVAPPQSDPQPADDIKASPVTSACLQCICEASSGCNPKAPCVQLGDQRRCGAYQYNINYWVDAGNPGYHGAANDFERCATDMTCAEQTVTSYLAKWTADCNGDGNVDCLDYAAIHKAGVANCNSQWLLESAYWKDFNTCYGFQ